MPRYVALLRGINVGKNNRISMADLRNLIEGLGHADVRTHLNSGNVVFTASKQLNEVLATDIQTAITSTLDLDVPVIVRTGQEMRGCRQQPVPRTRGEPHHPPRHLPGRNSRPESGRRARRCTQGR